MTLSSTVTKVSYNGDDSTVIFAVSFVFWDNADIKVIHRDAAGTETVWVEGTQYTLTGGNGATGTVTVDTSPTDYTPATGEKLIIKDAQPETQGDALPLGGAFPSTVVEQRFDKMTRMIQNQSEQFSRSILLPESAALSGLTIPEPGAGELVRYNLGGTNLETIAIADINLSIDTLLTTIATNDFLTWDGAQSAWVNIAPGATGLALFQDATAAAARTELGAGTTGNALFQDETAADARTELELGTAALVNTGVADGNVPAMDATGYPAADGSQITDVAAATVATITAAQGASMVLLASYSPVTAASVDITSVLTSTYKRYIIDIVDYVPATNDSILWLRTSTNNSTFDTGASDYAYATFMSTLAATGSNSIGNAADTKIILAGALGAGLGIGSAAGEGAAMRIDLFNPLGTALYKKFVWKGVFHNAAGAPHSINGYGVRSATADVDAIQILPSTGNIASAEIRVYGVKEV